MFRTKAERLYGPSHYNILNFQSFHILLNLFIVLRRSSLRFCFFFCFRRFSIKCCAKCRLGIAANEMVMRAKDLVYHMNCFSCYACAKTLLPGDYFGMRDGLVYCRDDYEAIIQGQTLQSLSPGVLGSVPDDIPFYTGNKRVQKGRPRKRKIPPPEGNGYTQRTMGKQDISNNGVRKY